MPKQVSNAFSWQSIQARGKGDRWRLGISQFKIGNQQKLTS
jgi:hypothetical protein